MKLMLMMVMLCDYMHSHARYDSCYDNDVQFGAIYMRYRKEFKYYCAVDLIKKFMFASAITFTNTHPLVQVILTGGILITFGLMTLVMFPHRSRLSNLSEGLLGVLAGATILMGLMYDGDQTDQQNRVVCDAIYILYITDVINCGCTVGGGGGVLARGE